MGWQFHRDGRKVIRSATGRDDILIYPSILKYDYSLKQPYIALIDRLSNNLRQEDSVLFVCGYSFGDEHINERIITAMRSNQNAHVFVLLYDKEWENGQVCHTLTEDSSLAKLAKDNTQLSIFSSRNAVIGSQYDKWAIPEKLGHNETIILNQFFEKDVYSCPEEPLNQEVQEKEQ